MPGSHRWLTALALALLLAGAGGVVAHRGTNAAGAITPGIRPRSPATATTSGTQAPSTSAVPVPSVPVPSVPAGSPAPSAALAGGMITPTDMGGYYRIDPGSAAAILDSAPCLAGLAASPSQAGRADTALLGPDLHSVPTIVEVAASYPGQEPAAVYRQVVQAVASCPSFRLTFGGTPIAVPLQAMPIPPVGLADYTWAGTAPYAGGNIRLELGVVLAGHSVVALMWIDSVPPSAAIMGDFTSTLSAALGKLA